MSGFDYYRVGDSEQLSRLLEDAEALRELLASPAGSLALLGAELELSATDREIRQSLEEADGALDKLNEVADPGSEEAEQFRIVINSNEAEAERLQEGEDATKELAGRLAAGRPGEHQDDGLRRAEEHYDNYALQHILGVLTQAQKTEPAFAHASRAPQDNALASE